MGKHTGCQQERRLRFPSGFKSDWRSGEGSGEGTYRV